MQKLGTDAEVPLQNSLPWHSLEQGCVVIIGDPLLDVEDGVHQGFEVIATRIEHHQQSSQEQLGEGAAFALARMWTFAE